MMLPDYVAPTDAGTGSGTPNQAGGVSLRGSSENSNLPTQVQQVLYIFIHYLQGIEIIITQPERVYHTFIRSGYIEFTSPGATGLAINLAYVESMPLAGALAGAPILVLRRLRSRSFEPIHAIDAFAVTYAVLTTLFYMFNLPAYATLTVRYLYPLFPLAIYGSVRLPWVREVIADRPTWLVWTYVGGVLIGAQLLLAGVVVIDATIDEAMQGFGLLNLTGATLVGGWSIISAFKTTDSRIGAILLAIAAALGTNLLLVTIIYYFGSTLALPILPNF